MVFLTISLKKCDFQISKLVCSIIATFARLGDQVGATRAQKLHSSGPKSRRTGKWEGSGQSSQTGRFGPTVGAMEKSGNHHNSAENQVKSEVKVYLSDKSYD